MYLPSGKRLSGKVFDYGKRCSGGLYFVQVGANDGIRNDPVFKAMMAQRWRGLRLEPQPFVFGQLARLHQSTPGIRAVQAALGPRVGTVCMYGLAFSNQRWAHGLCTMDRKILEQGLSDGSIAKAAHRHGVELPPNQEDWVKEIVVNQMDVASLMQMTGRQYVDLLVIDTEGYDLEIIYLFSRAGLWPGAILYEHVNLTAKQVRECANLLEGSGYQLHMFGANTFAERVG
ncbi:MAG: FkbM family methyltransferase [Bacteroidetes bacterium]|jgi:FkbM family methyltransferase|nr:FkbM family methyltransferase [Bacteroidota bacterium]